MACVGLAVAGGAGKTVHVEIDEWKNTSWGFHSIDRWKTRCEIAVSSDGSRHNLCESRSFRHYLIPDGQLRLHTLYLRPPNMGWQLNDDDRIARGGECACTWTSSRLSRTDPDCTDTAQELMEAPKRAGTGQIAGQRIIRYREVDDQGTDVEAAFAPDRDCELMEKSYTYRGTLGIPGGRWRYLITLYKMGEPDPHLFRLPAGYISQKLR